MRSRLLGIRGEDLASEYLESHGYEILERNWRHQKAEIDILALKEDVLVVVEVKTRSSNAFGEPNEFIKRKQVQLLRSAANAYVTLNRLNLEVRLDIIGVILERNEEQLTHIEDVGFAF